MLLRINLILLVAFVLGMIAISLVVTSTLQENASREVLAQAGLMLDSAAAIRSYTETEIGPLLDDKMASAFRPQSVPFYAATQNFLTLHKAHPDYSYKEATLNPTNPRDRATDWEADLIQYFRDRPNEKELTRSRETANGPSLYLAHPIRVEAGCMQCHSQPALAPKTMLAKYGDRNGFGWNLGEVVGAQIVSVPASLPIKIANQGLLELTVGLSVIFTIAILLIDLGLYLIVIRPLRTISDSANRISQGEMDLEQLSIRGNDEVTEVTRSFNRMHTSLKKAMDLLGE